MKAVILAIVAFGTLLSVLARSSTGASFTDQVTSNGNTFTSGQLAVPGSFQKTSPAGTSFPQQAISFSWTATTSTWATGYKLYRRGVASGVCSGSYAVVGSEVTPRTTTTTTDPTPPVGSDCYVIRATFTSGGSTWESGNSTEVGPFTVSAVTPSQLLMENATDLKQATSPSGSFLVSNGGTVTLKSEPAATSSGSVAYASNATNWTLNIVLTAGEPNANNVSLTVVIWWQSSNSCSGTPLDAQTFAKGSVSLDKPGPTDNVGRQLTIPAMSGSVSRTFLQNDVLCLKVTNTSSNSQDSFHIKTNLPSTAGVVGIKSGLVGPMSLTP